MCLIVVLMSKMHIIFMDVYVVVHETACYLAYVIVSYAGHIIIWYESG
jgi:hypothetical protein